MLQSRLNGYNARRHNVQQHFDLSHIREKFVRCCIVNRFVSLNDFRVFRGDEGLGRYVEGIEDFCLEWSSLAHEKGAHVDESHSIVDTRKEFG